MYLLSKLRCVNWFCRTLGGSWWIRRCHVPGCVCRNWHTGACQCGVSTGLFDIQQISVNGIETRIHSVVSPQRVEFLEQIPLVVQKHGIRALRVDEHGAMDNRVIRVPSGSVVEIQGSHADGLDVQAQIRLWIHPQQGEQQRELQQLLPIQLLYAQHVAAPHELNLAKTESSTDFDTLDRFVTLAHCPY